MTPASAPPAVAPPTPGPLAAASARVVSAASTPLPPGAPDHEVSLVGGAPLEAPAEVVDYVKGKGGPGAPVRVRVGNVAAGTVTMKAGSKGLRTTRTQGIPLLLPLFDPLRTAGIEPVLAVDVEPDGVQGYASVRTGTKLVSKGSGLAGELRKHADLLGWAGLDKLSLPRLTNELKDTTLVLEVDGLSFEVSRFLSGTGTFTMANEVVTFKATATGKVPGLATVTVPIERKADGSLSGEVDVDLTLKGFTGQVKASYAHGVVDVVGTVKYANDKFEGSVTLAATDKENAKALTAAHTPAEVKTAAPAAEGAIPHEGAAPPSPAAPSPAAGAEPPGAAVTAKPGPRVLVGWGSVNVHLAEWLSGEAVVVVDAAGHVTIVGKITPKMTKPLFEQRDYKYPLPKIEVRAGYGVPVIGNIFVFANIGIEALAKLGPATLTDLEMTGTYSTDPAVLQSFGLTATLNISAFAGIRVTAEGGAGIEVADHDLKIGVALSALAGIRGYVDAKPRIGYREVADPAAGKKGEFYIGGHLDLAAQPFLQLGGDFFVDLDSPWWSPAPDKRWTWPLGQLEYPLPGEFGIGADVEHVLGSGKTPEIAFGPVDFNASRFMTDLVDDHVPPKKSADQQKKGGWKEPPAPAAAAPSSSAPAAPGKQLATGAPGAPPQVSGAKAPAKGAPPKANGPSGKTDAEAGLVPTQENDAKVKKAMAGLSKIVEKEKSHPEDEAQINETLAKIRALGFTVPPAKAEGDHWVVSPRINPPPPDIKLPKAKEVPGGAGAKPIPPELSKYTPNTDITMKEGAFAGQRGTLVKIEAAPVTFAGRSSEYRLVFQVGKTKVHWHALDSSGKNPTFDLAGPMATGPRKRLLTTPEAGKRGEHVAGEVGVSKAYLKPEQEPDGYDILAPPRWDRAHLLDGWLDGPGERWNLAMVPKPVNQELHHMYEKVLKRQAPKGYRYTIDVRVHYHQAGDKPDQVNALRARNKNFDITRFPKGIDVSYKPVEPPATESGAFGTWVGLPRPEEITENP
ncbi:hypothetical protein [Nocardioides sp. zg-1230]|uniref:hypothetical protein n=1 Tax=Nocardioides sp. zg-1230 TaxID=2736601 RepID=UPI001557C3FA|nr:hypothetical protein [Nocardioides sp. zg-1230]NPC44589.1 hypothetical protein [Nocardioides sp. zg-1230]